MEDSFDEMCEKDMPESSRSMLRRKRHSISHDRRVELSNLALEIARKIDSKTETYERRLLLGMVTSFLPEGESL